MRSSIGPYLPVVNDGFRVGSFNYISSFSLSPDSAYIAYTGYSPTIGFVSYVYDLHNQRDEALGGLIKVTFSPNGKNLAWISEDKVTRKREILIRNLETRETKRINYPLDPSIKDYRMTEVAWSDDSRSLYVGTIAFPAGQYARYDLSNDQLLPIEGRFHPFHDQRDLPDAGLHFSEGGHDVNVFRSACLQWQCGTQGSPMPGASAFIDEQYHLIVVLPSGERVVVAQGDYNQCEGSTIEILSWVEGGKYLTFRLHGTVYIFGVAERRMSPLFRSGVEFGWDDRDERRSIPAYW